jgi:hypothetical protein
MLVALCSIACSSSPMPEPGPGQGQRKAAPPAVVDAGPATSEHLARAVLDRMFRDAGLRILSDVPVELPGAVFTVDGFDPERRIGYEYLDEQELGLDLEEAELTWLKQNDTSILVIEPTTSDRVESIAQRFLQRLTPDAGPP